MTGADDSPRQGTAAPEPAPGGAPAAGSDGGSAEEAVRIAVVARRYRGLCARVWTS